MRRFSKLKESRQKARDIVENRDKMWEQERLKLGVQKAKEIEEESSTVTQNYLDFTQSSNLYEVLRDLADASGSGPECEITFSHGIRFSNTPSDIKESKYKIPINFLTKALSGASFLSVTRATSDLDLFHKVERLTDIFFLLGKYGERIFVTKVTILFHSLNSIGYDYHDQGTAVPAVRSVGMKLEIDKNGVVINNGKFTPLDRVRVSEQELTRFIELMIENPEYCTITR